MLSKLFTKKRPKLPKKMSYDEAKVFARDTDVSVRADLAARADVAPEILYFLAEDKDPSVRKAVAVNDHAPGPADMLLAKDNDVDVRTSLAGKMARLAPGLSADEQDKLRRATFEALSMLAKDQAVLVREILSDSLKEVADAPPDVIRRLAFDVEAAVSTPVLRFSPVLTDDDLIEVINKRPNEAVIGAVAQREKVSMAVTDAISETNDTDAIALLLGNHSAQIREETLDHIIDRAVDIDLWHKPLARRPQLPKGAAVKIARFVADDILDILVQRKDLQPGDLKAVQAAVARRLSSEQVTAVDLDDATGKKGDDAKKAGVTVDDDDVFDVATKMWADGKLDEKAFIKSVNDDQPKLAMAMIAVMGDFKLGAVEKTIKSGSAKNCVALAWKAGLSAETAELVQKKLGNVSKQDLLLTSFGEFPLEDDELKWQVEFIQGL